ncbi:MAG TPA: ATP-binding cassette domain-containing protein, partial [Nitratifractor sp.]|nr:ATP-binding cassette domain-containing protein [Nitratifractor sp.]
MVVVENLNKTYAVGSKQERILDSITLHIQKGELVLLRGVSGSGKTTLLSILAGLEKPSSGKVLIDSEPISKLPDIHLSHFRAKKIGMVFQHFNLIETLTLLDNVLVPLVANRIGVKEAKEMAFAALKRARIEHKKDAHPNRLSGGEKQRGAIARAIV